MHFYDSHRFILTCQTLLGTSFLVYINGDNVAITQFSMAMATFYHGIYLILLYMAFSNGSASENNHTLTKNFPLAGIIVQLLFVIQLLGFIVIVLLTWWKRNKELDFYQKLHDFDTKMSKNFRFDFAYGRARWQTILAIAVIVGYGGFLCGFTVWSSESFKKDAFVVMLPLFLQMAMLSMHTYSFFYCTYLLKVRFREMKAVASEHGRSVGEIKTLFKFYKQLHGLIGTVNDVYGLKQLINILNDFIIITIELFFVFTVFISEKESIRNSFKLAMLGCCWVLPHSVKLFLGCFGSHTALLEARETGRLLQNMSLRTQSKDLRETTDFFTLGAMHHAEDFNASEFFTIDMTLIYAIISAICTYFVVLLQFSDV